jgi:hypothetical protein
MGVGMSPKQPQQRDLFPEALEMMVLWTLKRQPLHGYALAQHLKRMSNDLLRIERRITVSRAATAAEGRVGEGGMGRVS